MADKATIQLRPGFDWSLVNWGAPDQPRTDRCSYCGDYFPDEFQSDFIPLILSNKDGWVAEFCDRCQAAWFGVETFPEPAEGEDHPELGACCVCQAAAATTIVMLNHRAPIAGHGWGCVVCGLPSDGALAVVCEECSAKLDNETARLKTVCRGFPASDGRAPIEALSDEPFEHDFERHMAEERGGADAG